MGRSKEKHTSSDLHVRDRSPKRKYASDSECVDEKWVLSTLQYTIDTPSEHQLSKLCSHIHHLHTQLQQAISAHVVDKVLKVFSENHTLLRSNQIAMVIYGVGMLQKEALIVGQVREDNFRPLLKALVEAPDQLDCGIIKFVMLGVFFIRNAQTLHLPRHELGYLFLHAVARQDPKDFESLEALQVSLAAVANIQRSEDAIEVDAPHINLALASFSRTHFVSDLKLISVIVSLRRLAEFGAIKHVENISQTYLSDILKSILKKPKPEASEISATFQAIANFIRYTKFEVSSQLSRRINELLDALIVADHPDGPEEKAYALMNSVYNLGQLRGDAYRKIVISGDRVERLIETYSALIESVVRDNHKVAHLMERFLIGVGNLAREGMLKDKVDVDYLVQLCVAFKSAIVSEQGYDKPLDAISNISLYLGYMAKYERLSGTFDLSQALTALMFAGLKNSSQPLSIQARSAILHGLGYLAKNDRVYGVMPARLMTRILENITPAELNAAQDNQIGNLLLGWGYLAKSGALEDAPLPDVLDALVDNLLDRTAERPAYFGALYGLANIAGYFDHCRPIHADRVNALLKAFNEAKVPNASNKKNLESTQLQLLSNTNKLVGKLDVRYISGNLFSESFFGNPTESDFRRALIFLADCLRRHSVQGTFELEQVIGLWTLLGPAFSKKPSLGVLFLKFMTQAFCYGNLSVTPDSLDLMKQVLEALKEALEACHADGGRRLHFNDYHTIATGHAVYEQLSEEKMSFRRVFKQGMQSPESSKLHKDIEGLIKRHFPALTLKSEVRVGGYFIDCVIKGRDGTQVALEVQGEAHNFRSDPYVKRWLIERNGYMYAEITQHAWDTPARVHLLRGILSQHFKEVPGLGSVGATGQALFNSSGGLAPSGPQSTYTNATQRQFL